MTSVSKRTASVDSVLSASTAFLIPISQIRVPTNHRKHTGHAIQALAENIDIHGQLQPITVMTEDQGYRLVFGALRLEALRNLNRAEIRAEVKTPEEFPSEASERLASISENMLRDELTILDRSLAIADWCAIYRAAQPQLKPGPKPAALKAELSLKLILNSDNAARSDISAQFSASFSEAAQSFLGISRAAVFRALKIAAIASPIRDRIVFHVLANNQVELLALASEPIERQKAILDLILGKTAINVADAIDILDDKPRVVLPTWEALTQKFTRLGEAHQDRFFDLNEPAIARWQAKRGR